MCSMWPPEVNVTCQSWSRIDWCLKLELLRTMCEKDLRMEDLRNLGVYRLYKTITRLIVYEQLNCDVRSYAILKHVCPMYSSRPIISLNNNLSATKTRQSCEIHFKVQKLDKANVFVIPPPPGFLVNPKTNCIHCLRRAGHIDIKQNEELDINSLIEEFRTQSKVHEEYESIFFLKKFFIDNLNANFGTRDNTTANIYNHLLQGAPFEKIAAITYEFLRRVGFDAVLFKVRCVSSRFVNMWAMEFCCNDLLSSEVISACNLHAESRKRMSYTSYF